MAFKKEVALKAASNKRKLDEEKPKKCWNAQKRKWAQPATPVGHKAMTAREVFGDMKDEG